MKNKRDISSGRLLGLARAWGAYVRMLAMAIIARQSKIAGMMKDSPGGVTSRRPA